jgi:hypothetical protein
MLQAKTSRPKMVLQIQKQTEFGLDIREKNFQKNIFCPKVARGRIVLCFWGIPDTYGK